MTENAHARIEANQSKNQRRPLRRNEIRELRSRLNITQEEFAHAVGVTVSTVNRWENGHAGPSKLAWSFIVGFARKRGVVLD